MLAGILAVGVGFALAATPSLRTNPSAEASVDVRRVVPDATWISAGMSGDLEEAIAHGATHLRVGSAVLGPRPAFK